MYHLWMIPFNFNRTANGVLCDAVHRQYQGIPPPQKSQFHSSGVNVILFKLEGKLCPNPVHCTLDVGYFFHNAMQCKFCKLILLTVMQHISQSHKVTCTLQQTKDD